jgi:hypothetical protein
MAAVRLGTTRVISRPSVSVTFTVWSANARTLALSSTCMVTRCRAAT